jgi:DNA-binding HxlR family transcriptional regulator
MVCNTMKGYLPKAPMSSMNEPENQTCITDTDDCAAFQRGSELLGRRWTSVIIFKLLHKPHRFNELLSSIPGLSDRLLTERLRELEENGLVERHVIPESPVRVEYSLTEAGRDAHEIVAATWRWANKWLEPEKP